ncbi:MAG TPA: MGMT family protein [Pseudogracilibacillus sp.]|nr:MGMT family protein [Pseudogracilibacillus sp.]
MNDFTKQVIELIRAIPEKHVMTYGQIARLAGKEKGARGVSWILHSMSRSYQLPWHRVVNQQGKISHQGSEQRELLEMEGIEFSVRGKLDLKEYQYHPKEEDASGDS